MVDKLVQAWTGCQDCSPLKHRNQKQRDNPRSGACEGILLGAWPLAWFAPNMTGCLHRIILQSRCLIYVPTDWLRIWARMLGENAGNQGLVRSEEDFEPKERLHDHIQVNCDKYCKKIANIPFFVRQERVIARNVNKEVLSQRLSSNQKVT